MILQTLTQYYEELAAQGRAARQGWAKAKVSYGLELDDDGQIVQLYHLQNEVTRGKKTVLVPQEITVPAPVKRTVGIAANFLCDNSSYLLGADSKGSKDDKSKPARAEKCFAAAKALHEELLRNASSPAARAVLAFFSAWQPQAAAECPALRADWDDLMKGGNLLFYYGGKPVTQDDAVQAAWQAQGGSSAEGADAICLVTGRRTAPARLHPNIKGVAGAQSSGASLVSFNAPSFESYGHEQGANAPTGEYAAFAYTTALNTLLADREHTQRVGDTTIVCWAQGGEASYQDMGMTMLLGGADGMDEREFRSAVFALESGRAIDWQSARLDPDTRFYILGLAPNAARLSVRFFWQDSFGTLARNVARHYERLSIVRSAYETKPLTIRRLLWETVNQNARNPEPDPRLAGDLLQAVLNDGLYPATLLNGVALRIRAEREITYGRAAILKAYYLCNSQDEKLKEVLTVELNEQSEYLPYVLGRLFSVLESLQQRANPGINTTIRDRYFNSASATPASVFPLLLNLAQKHLAKLDGGLPVYYSKQISDLTARIHETLPARLTLAEQGAFQIGYYHETQKRYTKKEEK